MAKEQKPQKNIIYPQVYLKDVTGAFWRGIKPKKWLLVLLVATIVIANLCSIFGTLFYKQFFDVISQQGVKADVAVELVKIIIYIALINTLFWFCYRIATWANNDYQPKVIANLKQQSYDYLMDHSYGFFTNNFTGSLVQRVNRFARAFETLSDRLIWDVLPLIVRVLSVLIVVYFINKWLTLAIFVWVAVFISFNIIFSRWKLKYDIKVAEIDSKTTGYLSDTITNQNNVQLFAGKAFEFLGFKKVTEEQAKATKLNWNLDSIMEAVQGFLGFAVQFVLFYFAIIYWKQGLVTVGVFVLLEMYIITLIDHLWGFTRVIRYAYQSYADAKEMVEIIKLPHEIQDSPTAKILKAKEGKIDFKDVNFSFNETRQVLKHINLEIKPGEKVALVGPSGAGKTTIVRLLLRLYQVASGEILIDGQNILEVTQDSLRENISMVPQDPVLFHRTIAQNIAYGKRNATKKEIEKAARLAHCDEFLKDLPYGLETFVGERGIKLSGGERQRVAIARAILKNAPILVLDEATSSLDSYSEGLIQDALNTLMANCTTIVIAHRLSTIQKMDRILVVDEGKIIEQGSHAELLKQENSLYRKLWTLQAGGFLQEEGGENDEPASAESSGETMEDEDSDEEGGAVEADSVNF